MRIKQQQYKKDLKKARIELLKAQVDAMMAIYQISHLNQAPFAKGW
jgi:hypothetical protein